MVISQSLQMYKQQLTTDPSGSPVIHGGNPQDHTGSQLTNKHEKTRLNRADALFVVFSDDEL
ncbi:hypothetical protein A6770_05015 [Nostoc minutum NIES-26]|uniref:Uncharacterized protein n=1 Tax=Nostoc minutum NIES-26 TaxID=1844469 RepID=A0A367QCX5_9NOSO|nr:hypothetical protein A6770_05015 [Nostoc minutum NIES-26]